MEVKKNPGCKSVRKQPTAVSRMKQDYLRLKRDPLPYITAEPLPNNILEWHYVVKGPEDSPYYGGYYHGFLLFSREFPFKPPSIFMHTPNGRFQTNTRLCLSISDFHPDTWNPTWCVGTILTGLLSFMLESTATLGSLETTTYEKQVLARKSLAFNLQNPHFVELFPDISEEISTRLQSENQLQLKEFNVGASNQINIQADTKSNGTVANVDSARAQPYDYADGSDLYFANSVPMAVADSSTSLSDSYLNWQINAIILICFAIFACVVNYVIQNINHG